MSRVIKEATAVADLPVHLCLSGGGFRAAFFHIGALYALAERDRLTNLGLIVSVSGGSIAAAMYLSALDVVVRESESGAIDYQDAVLRAYSELIFCSKYSPRHRAIGSFRALTRGLVYNEFGTSQAMERQYAKWLRSGITDHTPTTDHLPEWRIAASDCISGNRVQLVFNDCGVQKNDGVVYCTIERDKIPAAISASAAVPVLFEPVTWRVSENQKLRLSDGGVLDNQGVRELDTKIADCICVDASARLSEVTSISGWQTSLRAMDMLMEQARTDFISSDIELYELRQPKNESARPEWWQKLMDLRTDLDTFNELEIDLLFLAGYQSVAGTGVCPDKNKLHRSQNIWRFVLEVSKLEPQHSDVKKINTILERGRYRFFEGVREPSLGSVAATIAAVYMSASVLAMIGGYFLIGFFATSKYWPEWLLRMNALFFLSGLWILTTAFLVAFHMTDHHRIPGHQPRLWTVLRVLTGGVFLPVAIALVPIIRVSAIFSSRDYGVHRLYVRVNKFYGKDVGITIGALMSSVKRAISRKKWVG